MHPRFLCWPVALASLFAALAPTSIAHAEHRIYLPFAFGPACNFASPAYGPTPGPLPTLAARRWEHLRPANDVQAMALDPRTGDVWSVGIDGAARRSRDGALVKSYTEADGLEWSTGTDLAVAPNGSVWAIVGGDLARLNADGRSGSINVPVDADHVAVDRSGGVWVGGGSGVARLGATCGWESPVRGYPLGPKVSVTDMLAAANGDVWVAYAPQGAPAGVAVRRADGRWESFDSADGLRIELGPIPMLAERPDGQIWALYGTLKYSNPLQRIVAFADVLGNTGRWTPASMDEVRLAADETGLHSIAFDRAGRPWFGGTKGIYVPDDNHSGRWNFEVPGRGVAWATGLILDADGVAWMGSGTVSRRLPDGTWRQEWIGGPESPNAVAVDGAEVWMDTHHRNEKGEWQHFLEGFPSAAGEIRDIALAPDGVWYATATGLVHLAPDGAWTQFAGPDALGGRDVSRVVTANDGSVWAVAKGMSAEVFVTRHRPDGRWEPHSVATGLPSGQVRDVATGGGGAVWVGIEGSSRGHIASLQADGSWTDVAMPADVVTSGIVQLAGDGTGAVWLFSGERGLVRRSADGTWDAFTGQPLLDLQPAGERQPYDPTLAIAPDGSAWLGGLPGEVRVRRPDGAWRSLMLLDLSRARDIAFGPDGRAWMTMVDGGSPRVVEVGPVTTSP